MNNLVRLTYFTNAFVGVDLETLDKAMKDFGMPVGPITLSDEVGIDISNHVGMSTCIFCLEIN